ADLFAVQKSDSTVLMNVGVSTGSLKTHDGAGLAFASYTTGNDLVGLTIRGPTSSMTIRGEFRAGVLFNSGANSTGGLQIFGTGGGTSPILGIALCRFPITYCVGSSPTVWNVAVVAQAARSAALLNFQTSAAASLGNVSGGCVADVLADASTTNTNGTFDTLNTYTLPANGFIVNGDKLF